MEIDIDMDGDDFETAVQPLKVISIELLDFFEEKLVVLPEDYLFTELT